MLSVLLDLGGIAVKRFVAALMVVGGLLVAGGANATSVTWTIPTTALTGSATYTSVSGTFAWDAVTDGSV